MLIIQLLDKSHPITSAMFLPDCLRTTPPCCQALVGVEPVRLAVHETLAVPWNHRLEHFRDTKRKDALAKHHGPDELRLDYTFHGGQILPRFLVIRSLERAHADFARGHSQRPGDLTG